VLVLEHWRDLSHGRDQIRQVADRLGHRDRGESLIGEIDAALARANALVPATRSILALYRRGWVPSGDSLIGELLRHTGFTLHRDALGLSPGGLARVESIVASPPDFVLMDDIEGRSIDNGSALLVHPALIAALPAGRRLALPSHLTICGGPSTPAMIDALAAEIRRKVR
jgi:iron complex transport system substrate-binding protein